MKRHQLALVLGMCQVTLGDKLLRMELDRLYRGMPLMYKTYIDKKIKEVDLRDSQEVVRNIVSYIVINYMKRKNGFLSGYASNIPPKETAVVVADWLNQLNLPLTSALQQELLVGKVQVPFQTVEPHRVALSD